MMDAETTRARAAGLRALWFGILTGPAAWSAQELVSYAVAAQSCFPGRAPRPEPIIDGVGAIVGAVSVAAVLVTVAAGVIAVRSWRAAARAEPRDAEVASRDRFMSFAGVLVSALFLVAVVFTGIPVLLVEPC